jgi:hypothetical protein
VNARLLTVLVVAGLLPALSLQAHHSDAGLDMVNLVTFEGVVTEYSMRNPHSYFTAIATNDQGEEIEWTVQMASALTISRRGWTSDSLQAGDRVSVGLHPALDGRHYGLIEWIATEGGESVNADIVAGRGDSVVSGPLPTTSSIEGRWIVDRTSLADDYPGGLDQLTLAELSLTEKGAAAEAAYSQNSEENPELACISKPTPSMIVYTDLYPMEIEIHEATETIDIRSQYFDVERTVFMDGREHPPADERSHQGHSIGWWEDDVLVVDTTNFTDHRSPYQNGIPAGARKHVIERYRLTEGGTHMTVEFFLEDPEYIVGSMTHTRSLIYSPDMDMSPFDCDLEATRRFVPR